MYTRYHRRSRERQIGNTGVKVRGNVSKGGASASFRKGIFTFNTRRGFSLNLGRLFKGLSIRSRS